MNNLSVQNINIFKDLLIRKINSKAWISKHNKLIEFIICALLLVVSSIISFSEITNYRNLGYQPQFYQIYFEPAVSLACGKGFTVHNPPILFRNLYQTYLLNSPYNEDTPLYRFLSLKQEKLDCSELPTETNLQKDSPQRLWYYLIASVGFLWKLTGISWATVDYLVSGLFALSIIFIYGIFRLGMGRIVALPFTLLICGSTLHLNFLPTLRDYAKAPFFLAIFLIMGYLIKTPIKASFLYLISSMLGLILGVGYGFRSDILVTFIPIVLLFLFFLPGPIFSDLYKKLISLFILFSVFCIIALPIFTADLNTGSCEFDHSLQGLMTPFSKELKIGSSPIYEFGHHYNDFLSSALVATHGNNFLNLKLDNYINPNISTFSYCTPNYDLASFSLNRYLIALFPADILLRAYAAIKQILYLGFTDWPITQMNPDNIIHNIYKSTRPLFCYLKSCGIFLFMTTTFLLFLFQFRVAIFFFLSVIFFASYPAVQFDSRHYFHLEFISLWLVGFLLYHLICFVQRKKSSFNFNKKFVKKSIMASSFILVFGFISLICLFIARKLQVNNLQNLISIYEAAPKKHLTKSFIQSDNDSVLIQIDVLNQKPFYSNYASGKMIMLEFGGIAGCEGKNIAFSIEYDFSSEIASHFNFSKNDKSLILSEQKSTLIFSPVFQHKFYNFKGIRIQKSDANCLKNVYEVTGLENYPVWLYIKLPPHWKQQALYQSIAN